jgi:hypothetical protein
MFFKKAAACVFVLYATSSHAATIFSDNFDADTMQFNATLFNQNWQVRGGSVDVQGAGFSDLMPNNGSYVDLDGSTNNAGLLTNVVALTGGQQYTLWFDLAGNHRDAGQDTVRAIFGTTEQIFTLGAGDAFQTYSINFTPNQSGIYNLGFRDFGHDNQGALLDRVSVTAVPEPETYAMLIGGLAMLGFVTRRRRRNCV